MDRQIDQGGLILDLNYSKRAIDVTMSDGSVTHIPVHGALITDAPAMDMLLSALPLEEGYEVTFNTLNIQGMTSRPLHLVVVGVEEMQGRSCWKVILKETENPLIQSTFWINQNDGIAERMEWCTSGLTSITIITTRRH